MSGGTGRDMERDAIDRGSGRLVVVATPIGNLTEMAPRTVDTLASAEIVACEDTRRTAKLYTAAGIARPET